MESPTNLLREAQYQTFEVSWRTLWSSEASDMLRVASNQVDLSRYCGVFFGYFGAGDRFRCLVHDQDVKVMCI